MSYKIISMYTANTPYEQEIKGLKESLDKLPEFIDRMFYKIENVGDWMVNCKFNANIILEAMLEFPDCNIVMIDADARVLKIPELFDRLDCDLALHKIRYENHIEHCTGTLFVKNTDIMQHFIMDWININQMCKTMDDQQCLEFCLKHHDEIKVDQLPIEYCCIDGNRIQRQKIIGDVIIKHTQASRRYKKIINVK